MVLSDSLVARRDADDLEVPAVEVLEHGRSTPAGAQHDHALLLARAHLVIARDPVRLPAPPHTCSTAPSTFRTLNIGQAAVMSGCEGTYMAE